MKCVGAEDMNTKQIVFHDVYTPEQIKQAFWDTFDGVGEVWFDYISSDAECDACTEEHWQEFMEHLTKGADND